MPSKPWRMRWIRQFTGTVVTTSSVSALTVRPQLLPMLKCIGQILVSALTVLKKSMPDTPKNGIRRPLVSALTIRPNSLWHPQEHRPAPDKRADYSLHSLSRSTSSLAGCLLLGRRSTCITIGNSKAVPVTTQHPCANPGMRLLESESSVEIVLSTR